MILGTRATYTRRVHEYGDVYSFFFRPGRATAQAGASSGTGARPSAASYAAGQYSHVHLGGLPSPRSIRELSFASAPHEDELRFTVHVDSGSHFKRRLLALQPGEQIGVFGYGGHTTLPEVPDGRPRVLIGGGTGMAPFRSLLLDAAYRTQTTTIDSPAAGPTGPDAGLPGAGLPGAGCSAAGSAPELHVVQVQRHISDGQGEGDGRAGEERDWERDGKASGAGSFLFAAEFDLYAASYRPVSPDGLREAITTVVADVPEAVFHLCGSSRLVTAVRGHLLLEGIAKTAITAETW